MTGRPKIAARGALLVGLSLLGLMNTLAIDWYPLAWTLPDGRTGAFPPADIRSCMGARLLSNLADPTSAHHWHRCAVTLHTAQALDGFGVRYWALIVAGGSILLATFSFALAVRFDRPLHHVTRGRRLVTGGAASAPARRRPCCISCSQRWRAATACW